MGVKVIQDTGCGGCGTARLVEYTSSLGLRPPKRFLVCVKLLGENSTLVLREDTKVGPCSRCRHNSSLHEDKIQSLKDIGREFVQSCTSIAASFFAGLNKGAIKLMLKEHLNRNGGVDKTKPEVREFFQEMMLASVKVGVDPEYAGELLVEEGLIEPE